MADAQTNNGAIRDVPLDLAEADTTDNSGAAIAVNAAPITTPAARDSTTSPPLLASEQTSPIFQEPPSARWFALGVTMIAGALASIQSTALIVALTDLTVKLQAEFITIMW